jgi:predicted RNase H-like nuclease (RuvC/YqgF family)
MHGMMWLLVPLFFILVMRNRSRRHWRWQHRFGPEIEDQSAYIAELQQTVEDQRSRIEDLEGRLARVEDGLEFAERLLTERPIPVHPDGE